MRKVRGSDYAGLDCNTMQYTATRSNTLQHTATHCNTFVTKMVKACKSANEAECERAWCTWRCIYIHAHAYARTHIHTHTHTHTYTHTHTHILIGTPCTSTDRNYRNILSSPFHSLPLPGPRPPSLARTRSRVNTLQFFHSLVCSFSSPSASRSHFLSCAFFLSGFPFSPAISLSLSLSLSLSHSFSLALSLALSLCLSLSFLFCVINVCVCMHVLHHL